MKKTFFKSFFAIAIGLLWSMSSFAAIDWSGIGWAENGTSNAAYTEAYKLSVPAGCGFVNIQNSFGTEAGFYVTLPAADITCSLNASQYAIQGAGMLLYVSAFTAQETEVTVTCNGGQNYVYVVYNKNGVAGPASAPASEYCSAAFGSGAQACRFTWETLDNGNIQVALTEPDGSVVAGTHFRGNGIKLAQMSVGSEPGSDYFTTGNYDGAGASPIQIFALKEGKSIPVGTAITVANASVEYAVAADGNAWPSFAFSYTYGGVCASVDAPANVAVAADGTITFDAVDGADKYIAYVYDGANEVYNGEVTNGGQIDYQVYVAKTLTVKVVAVAGTSPSDFSEAATWNAAASPLPASAWCETPGVVSVEHETCHPAFTINTLDNGNVTIVINATEGTPEGAKFRNAKGMNGTFKLNGDAAAFTACFDYALSADKTTVTLSLKGAAPALGSVIDYSGQIEAASSIHGNDWSDYKIEGYVYGTKCPAGVAVTSVALNKTTATLYVGDAALALSPVFTPSNAGNKNVTWATSAAGVATVANGQVTAVAPGEATITVTTEDGGFQATCVVTVRAAITAPTAPTWAADRVKAVYSATYGADCGFGEWGSGTQYTQKAAGKFYTPGNYLGLVFEGANAKNCAAMDHYHMDVYPMQDMTITVVPIWGGAEQGVATTTLTAGQWNSVDIAMSQWTGITNWTNIYQIKLDGLGGKAFYLNNVYFYREAELTDTEAPVMTSASFVSASFFSAVLAVEATDNVAVTQYLVKNGDAEVGKFAPAAGKITVNGLTAGTAYTLSVYALDAAENVSANKVDVEFTTAAYPAPVAAPTYAAADVKSLYSDAYTTFAAHTVGGWGQSTHEENMEIATGEHAYLMTTCNYQGWELGGNYDVRDMTHVHLDVYVAEAGSIGFTPIWRGGEHVVTKALVAGWNSIEIAMSEFTGVNQNTDIFQVKFADMPATCWIDNVFFVRKTISVTGVTLNKTTLTLAPEASETLVATVAPADATNKTVTWATNNAEVATVVDGVVTAVAEGTANITVTTEDGSFVATCVVTVENPDVVGPDEVMLEKNGHKIFYTAYKYACGVYELTIRSNETLAGFGGSFFNPGAVDVRTKTQKVGDKLVVTIEDAASAPQFYTPLYVMMPGEVNFGSVTIDWIVKNPVATASTEVGANTAEKALVKADRWESAQTDTEWWMVNYNHKHNFNAVKIEWEGAYAKEFTIEGSNDGTNFDVIYTESNGSAGEHLYSLDAAVDYQYVKVNITKRGTGWGNSIVYFETLTAVTSELTTLTLSAAKQFSAVGVANALTVAGKDQYNAAMAEFGEVEYTITPAAAGSVVDGKFVPAQAGMATISAHVGAVVSNEVTVWATTDAVNLALSTNITTDNKIIAHSNVGVDGYVAGSDKDAFFAVDGNDGSIWQGSPTNGNVNGSQVYDSWFVVDLGDKYDLELITIHFEGACSRHYHVDASLDNAAWTTLDNGGHEQLNYTAVHGITETTARYVRFWSTEAATGWGMKMYEFQVFGQRNTADDVHVTAVSLNKTATSLVEGAQETLVVTVTPDEATNKAVIWTSSADAIATVSDGVVTAVAPGEATITAKSADNAEALATCVVTVTADMSKPQTAAPAVATDGVEIRAIYTDDVELAIAHDFGFNPWGGAPVSKQVVAANNYLLVDAATANNMTMGLNNDGANAIIAKAGMSDPENADNKGLYVAGLTHCHIDIWSKVAKTGVKVLINDHALTAINLTGEGWQSFDIELVDGDMAAAANVRWMKVIDLPTGTKVAIDNIYFWKSNGTAAVTGVELNKATDELQVGQQTTLIATVAPAAAANKTVVWTSNNESVATVVDGVVTANAVGTAVITATSAADASKYASCTITVSALTEAVWYGQATITHNHHEVGVLYTITRMVDHRLKYDLTFDEPMSGVMQVKDASWNNLTRVGETNSYTYTSATTHEDGQYIVDNRDCFIYFGGPRIELRNYVVGSANAVMSPLVAICDTMDNTTKLDNHEGELVDVKLSRSFVADGYWYTLCLPFDMSAEQISNAFGACTISKMTDSYMKTEEMLHIDFSNVSTIEAGVPYLFMPAADIANPTIEGVTIDAMASTELATSKVTMTGFYQPTVVASPNLFLGANNYLLSNSNASATKAFRAYFTLDSSVPAGVRARVVMNGQTATDLDELEAAEDTVQKIFRNGAIYIIREGRIYTAQGQLVE